MTGKSHLAMNVATAVAIVDTSFLISNVNAPDWLKATDAAVRDFMFEQNVLPNWLFIVFGICLFLVGALFPDIDHKDSTLGQKGFYLPVGHRTWLHAIWLSVILFALGIFCSRLLVWLSIGIFFHLFWDSFSASGLYWFYPCKWKHPIKLYHTREMSEYVFLTINWVIVVVYSVVCLQLVYKFVDVTWKVNL